MSLFNEIVVRADRAEKALDAAQKEISRLEGLNKNLEIALKAAQRDKQNQPFWAGRSTTSSHKWKGTPSPLLHSQNYNTMNMLSDDDVEDQFRAKKYYDEQDEKAKMAKQADAAALKPAALTGVSVRSRLLAPLARLFTRETGQN